MTNIFVSCVVFNVLSHHLIWISNPCELDWKFVVALNLLSLGRGGKRLLALFDVFSPDI